MILYTTNILSLPILLLIWAIDLYLLAAGIRLILSRIPAASGASRGLGGFTDPVPGVVGSWLSAIRRKAVPAWLPWLLVGAVALILRQLLILLILRVH